jgi:hypothetical protein
MIQRNGRINRLGSPYEKVYIYNLHPANQLEKYLQLVRRLNHKINLIRNTVGTDQSIMGEKAAPVDFLEDSANEVPVETTLVVLTGNEDQKLQALQELEEEADFSLGEDAFIADLRRFDDNSDPATKQRVYFGIPFGKWGMLPAKTSELKDVPPTLTLVHFDITQEEGAEIIGDHSRFFASKPDAATFEAYDSLAALSHIKTTPDDNSRRKDNLGFDKAAVNSRILDYGQMLATSEYNSPRINKMKPSYTLVLDHLVTKLNMDVSGIYKALTEGSNRMFEKELDKGLRNAYERIKAFKPITDADLFMIIEAADKLNAQAPAGHILENMQITYNYAKPQ